ncbi:hypothetical protein KF913_13015 [Candidatus Obscuribacterales bacterium]|nr:hypothetical protein [Candidatus Obscuribacterales bacterium]
MDKDFVSTSTDKEVYVNRVETRQPDDSGTGWAVALIVLILAIGFGFVAFSNNQAMNDIKTSQTLEQMRRDNQALSTNASAIVPPVAAPTTNNVEVKVPEVKAPEAPAQVDVNVAPPEPAAEPALEQPTE